MTNMMVINRTIAKGTNENAPRYSCRYGNTRPTMKLQAQFKTQEMLTDRFERVWEILVRNLAGKDTS